MRRRTTSKLLATAGLAGFLAVSATAGLAKETAAAKDAGAEAKVFISSFAGAFLAARAADVDNDLKSAITYYTRALAYQPDNQEIRQALMLALIAEGRFDEALPHAEALRAVPEVERFSRLTLAVDALRKEEYADAENWLKLVLSSDLDKLITTVMTGWAEVGAGRSDEALRVLDTLKGPEWYGLFLAYHRGLVAIEAGDAARVRKEFDALLKDTGGAPAAPDTYMRGAEVYAAWLAGRGEAEAAIATLDEAEKLITGRAATMMLREAIETGGEVRQPDTDPRAGAAEILLNIATALNRSGGEPFVKLYLNLALALQPDSDDVLVQLASVAEQQSEAERAIDYYSRIKPDSPWRRLAELQTGLNLADLDRYEAAAESLNAAIDRDPQDMRAYLALGRVHAVQKDYRAAADVYDRAVAELKDPERPDYSIYYQRGIAYERLKEWDKAEPNFRKALELYPDQPQVLNYLGYSWVDMNIKLEEGLELIRRAVDLRPNDGYIVDSLGWAHYRLGQYEEAADELERAVSLRPDDPVLNDHLGDAYWRVGRRLEATFQWAHARDLDPEPDLLAEVEKKLKDGLPETAPEALTGKPDDAPETIASDGSADAADAKDTTTAPMMPKAGEAAGAGDAAGGLYVIRPGDTLWSIAAEQLGDGERFRDILSVNPALRRNPDLLRAGQEIHLPQ